MPKRVLVVEDDVDTRRFLRTALSYAGFDVQEAGDGLTALRIIDSGAPDAVVLDLGLPVMSGDVVRRQLAAQSHTHTIPIVIVTGQSGDHEGPDVASVLHKPVSASDLIRAVEQCLAPIARDRQALKGSQHVILLVEDEPAIRQLMTVALERAGYRVVQARHGREALDRFDSDVDLLLTDIRLPYLDGRQLIDELRARRQTLKVLAFSGYPGHALEDVEFLAKPFSNDELLDAVRAVLQ